MDKTVLLTYYVIIITKRSAFQTKDGDEVVRQIVERGEEKGM